MKNLKIVYVVVGNNDTYLHQLIISIASLHYFNPQGRVLCVTDLATSVEIRQNYKELIFDVAEIREVDIPQCFSTPMTQSRYIKTNLRNFIDGDFLFLDTDTIICGSLEPFTQLECDLGMVYDFHLPMVKLYPNYAGYQELFCTVGWEDINVEMPYFNSGVIFCRDTEENRHFFLEWHNTWKEFLEKGIAFDQVSLNYINQKQNQISELPGHFHCQIEGNGLKYFNRALIVHYYNVLGSENKKSLLHNSIIRTAIIEDILGGEFLRL